MSLRSGKKEKIFFIKLKKIRNKNIYHVVVTKSKEVSDVVEVLGLKYVDSSASFCFLRLDRLSFWVNLNTRFSYKVKKLIYTTLNYSGSNNVISKK